MQCRFCGSESCVKNGIHRGSQRHKCKKCGKQFNENLKRVDEGLREQGILLYILGLSFRTIADYIGVAPSTVLYWVRNFALKVYEKPAPLSKSVTIELDEMWHFLGSKKTKFGYGKPIAAIPVNSLIGSAESETTPPSCCSTND
jgi:transposase